MLESFERAAAAGLRAVGRHKRGTPGHQRAVLLTHDMLAEAKRHVLRADGKFQRWLMRTSRPRLSDLVEEFKTSARLVDLSASILDEHNAVEDAGGVRLVDEKIRRLFLSQRA